MRRPLLAAALAVACTACSVQTLGAPKGGFEFEAEFADVQALVVGHSVQISDVRVGTVTDIELTDDFKAHVTMELESGTALPQGVTASIAKTSLLGENYVRITIPEGSAIGQGPALAEGAVITQTSVQPDLESISEKVGPVLAAFGGQNLGEIVDAVATALKDKGPELNKLVKDISDISDSYASAAGDLQDTIDGLARLGASLESKRGDLDELPGRIIVATDRIEADRKELKSAVQELVELGKQFNDKIETRHAARLKTLLTKLDRILKKMVSGRETLKQLLKGLNTGLLGAPSLTYKSQGLMLVWLAGIVGFDVDASHVTSNQGAGDPVDLSTGADRALSPVGHKGD
ncbi:phospholipid/cholesterol/gamma-HCH transport system substrate-binding protein [Actinocorallia herbida]|uniref:Phospholipid/cholesterol/gamma-HCH transport system substrate-binding protein n=1 Tax=Actinocorallia herbida TaxID=58109 RepID=A0A3N1D3X7_9ACTN|nr:MCE family protein [Actinocorallia herbida]ROO88232.1 phospholipid/cholesterol/gamma-HCH transport system substrate-binding protein [Actinocorallia herbida]